MICIFKFKPLAKKLFLTDKKVDISCCLLSYKHSIFYKIFCIKQLCQSTWSSCGNILFTCIINISELKVVLLIDYLQIYLLTDIMVLRDRCLVNQVHRLPFFLHTPSGEQPWRSTEHSYKVETLKAQGIIKCSARV